MMEDVLIIRYGELTLKKKNYNVFLTTLFNNLKHKLKKYETKIEYIKEYQRLYIKILDKNIIDEIISDLKTIFGINSISIAKKIKNNIEEIKQTSFDLTKDLVFKTFKVECTRKNKKFLMNSMEIKNIIGGYILKKSNNNIKVNVNNPDLIINIEIREKFTLIFSEKIKLFGGLPLGCSGKALSLISGGIDSPVASFLTMKKGMEIDYIHFATPPHTSDAALEKVKNLIRQLKNFSCGHVQNLYVVDFTILQNELMHISLESYRITLMRRMFYRIANFLVKELNTNALITGESLGQVASQTIESLSVVNEIAEFPVLRPLITYDKEEIIDIAKKIKTYNISILPYEDCCSLFVPKKPVTKPKIHLVTKLENEILFQEIIKVIIENKIVKYNI